MWTKLWWGFITLTCEITESWRYDSRQLVLYKDKFHGNCHSRDPWEASIWHWIWRSSKDIRFSTPNDNKCTLKLETCPFALSTWHLLDNRWLYVKISVAVGFRVITKSECSKCDGRPCISSVLYDRGHQIYFFVFFFIKIRCRIDVEMTFRRRKNGRHNYTIATIIQEISTV